MKLTTWLDSNVWCSKMKCGLISEEVATTHWKLLMLPVYRSPDISPRKHWLWFNGDFYSSYISQTLRAVRFPATQMLATMLYQKLASSDPYTLRSLVAVWLTMKFIVYSSLLFFVCDCWTNQMGQVVVCLNHSSRTVRLKNKPYRNSLKAINFKTIMQQWRLEFLASYKQLWNEASFKPGNIILWKSESMMVHVSAFIR